MKEGLSSHAVYAVTVTKYLDDKEVSSWIVYRRYSDFNDFHLRMEGKVVAQIIIFFIINYCLPILYLKV